MKRFFVYLLATRKDGPVYVGVTSDLLKRAFEHRTHAVPGFTSRYNVDQLVWFEAHDTAETAIAREKRLKRWRRAWKIALIKESNPEWRDLFDDIAR
ncbi:GIY-YIG nuclease family protein [Ancylobacter sp. TS-1]|uniref:GIY-YIG nuclease family protein n=1 Tax=Ancylobacter sp. TS-1 TaxID=1850374 RepID=UPI001265C8E8|nr:GIY-YIG nuclease family protein [Ancylobacter sp. TS-1]QFR34311.1 GIY-YIG nuclease family protein [Ancylobacter sp. TS-1]